MRIYHLIAALAFLAAITVLPTYAQQRSAAAPQSAPAGAGGGTVPESKIAIVFTDVFLDPKNGITRINNLAASLDREFQPRRTELQGMQQRVQQLTDSISKMQQGGAPVDPKSIQTQIDQLDALKKDFQRKAEDAQSAFNKRQQEVLGPLQDDIGKALEAYAKSHGINVLIDASRVPLIYAADGLDITRAFIAEYNSRNPGTASAR